MQHQDRPGTEFTVRDTDWNFGIVPKLGAAKESVWEFQTEFWGHLYGTRGGQCHYWAAETPFFTWRVRNATHLPNDTLLFQLGKDTIVLFDPEVGRLARVAYGYGPVALLEED